jgi:hypothetical protein
MLLLCTYALDWRAWAEDILMICPLIFRLRDVSRIRSSYRMGPVVLRTVMVMRSCRSVLTRPP